MAGGPESRPGAGCLPSRQQICHSVLASTSNWRDYLVPVGGPRALPPSEIPRGALPLLDTASDAVHGGTGTSFDWGLIDDEYRPFVLAGGLGVDNVGSAIRTVRPHGVDASSRLETVPGRKDPDTIRAFIEEAKSA